MKTIFLASVFALAAGHSSTPCGDDEAAKATVFATAQIPADCLSVVTSDGISNVAELTTYLRKNKTKALALCTSAPCLKYLDTWKAAPECTIKLGASNVSFADVEEHFIESCEKAASNSTNGTKPNSTGVPKSTTEGSNGGKSDSKGTSAPTTTVKSSASTLTIGMAAVAIYAAMQ